VCQAWQEEPDLGPFSPTQELVTATQEGEVVSRPRNGYTGP
jgi:hypothetical protein